MTIVTLITAHNYEKHIETQDPTIYYEGCIPRPHILFTVT
jgi:hypothetical protein